MTSDETNDMKLTSKETDVLNKLAESLVSFLELPIAHRDDVNEFRAAIHQAQNIILSRPALRHLNYKEVDGGNDNG